MAKNLIHIIRKKCNVKPELVLEGGFLVTFLNPHSYAIARKSPEIFEKFDAIYIDGISLVFLLRLFGIPNKRMSFDMTSLAPVVFKYCSVQKKSVYFIGSKQLQIEKAVNAIEMRFSELNIIGYRNGYFEDELDEWNSIQEINDLNPDFVIVGMGTPKQEDFLIKLRNSGFDGNGFTCGGFFHQTSRGVQYYPTFFDKFNLRWLYRILDEPKLLKRYLILYPKAAILFIYDYFR